MEQTAKLPAPLPTVPPHAASSRMTGAGISALVLAWLIWSLAFASFLADVFMIHFAKMTPAEPIANPDFVKVLVLVSLVEVVAIFCLRGFGFHFLVHPRRLLPGSWSACLVTVAAYTLMLTLIKSIEVYGMILWFSDPTPATYYSFASGGGFLLLLNLPSFLFTKRVIKRPLPPY